MAWSALLSPFAAAAAAFVHPSPSIVRKAVVVAPPFNTSAGEQSGWFGVGVGVLVCIVHINAAASMGPCRWLPCLPSFLHKQTSSGISGIGSVSYQSMNRREGVVRFPLVSFVVVLSKS
jgi:hypothetical protein